MGYLCKWDWILSCRSDLVKNFYKTEARTGKKVWYNSCTSLLAHIQKEEEEDNIISTQISDRISRNGRTS